MRPVGILNTPTHLIIRVELDSRVWLVDVGFNSCNPTGPIEIGNTEEQVLSHDVRRLIRNDYGHLLQVKIPGNEEWISCYEFREDPVFPIDCELSNWWACTQPDYAFVKNLVASIVTPKSRYFLVNTTFTIRNIDGTTEKTEISIEEIPNILLKYFLLDIPNDTKFKCFVNGATNN